MARQSDQAQLELLAPWDAAHAAAHRARLVVGDGTSREVMAILGPMESSAGALSRARAAASKALAIRHPGVVQLLEVTEVDGRVAWVYEAVDGLSLAHVVGADASDMLDVRAAAEVVASVAETFRALGRQGLNHPGPEPSDLFLDSSGRVRVFGFAGPAAQAPSMRVPQDSGGEPATVYRLGVLLAHLVSGNPPAVASDEASHSSLIRRALIRAMARPGPVLTERFGDWIRGMLSWVPAERPPLSAVPEGLLQVAGKIDGGGLVAWSQAQVPRLIRQVGEAAEARRDASGPTLGVGFTDETTANFSGPVITGPPPRRAESSSAPPRRSGKAPGRRVAVADPDVSLPSDDIPTVFVDVEESVDGYQAVDGHQAVDLQMAVEDDDTQETDLPHAEVEDQPLPPLKPRAGALAMPVEVGPPPELVRPAPRLPRGFLEGDGWASDEVSLPPESRERFTTEWLVPALWGIIMVALVLIIGLLGGYLMTEPEHQGPRPVLPDGPVLRDVLTSTALGVPDVSTAPSDEVPPAPTSEAEPPDAVQEAPRASASEGVAVPLAENSGHSVLFRVADNARLAVRCPSTRATGRGEVRVSGLGDEVCTVTSNGKSAAVKVAGHATADCFMDGSATCLW